MTEPRVLALPFLVMAVFFLVVMAVVPGTSALASLILAGASLVLGAIVVTAWHGGLRGLWSRSRG